MAIHDRILTVAPLLAVVEAARRDGLVYLTDMVAQCSGTWATMMPSVDTRLPDLSVTFSHSEAPIREEWARLAEAEQSVVQGARGTWQLVRRDAEHGRTLWFARMHDGFGNAYNTHQGFEREPTFEALVDMMVTMEVYTVQREVEARHAMAEAVVNGRRLGLAQGGRLAAFRAGRERFSSGVVVEYDSQTGYVQLLARRRGTRREWDVRCAASSLSLEQTASTPQLTTRPGQASLDL